MPPTASAGEGSSRRRPGLLALFAGVSFFFAFIQVGSIALGVAGVAFDRTLALAVASASAILSLLTATRFVTARAGPDTASATAPGRATSALIVAIAVVLVAWAAWVWGRLWMLAALRPPYDWDGLYYHIPAIHEWVAAGRVVWIDTIPDVPWVNYPMGVELTTFLAYQLLQTSDFVNACNLWYWPLAFLSLAVIATRLGARGAWPWIAGAAIVGAPIFVSQSVSCYIDVGFAITVFASLAAALVFLFDDEHSSVRKGVLLGAAVGLMAGAKGTGLPFAFVVLAAVGVTTLWVGERRSRGRRLVGVAVAGLVVVVVAGFWYVRLAHHTGNPIYPIELRIGEKVIFEGNDVSGMMEENVSVWLAGFPPAARTLVSWLQLDAPVYGYDPIGGLGYVWIACGIPAIVLLWVRFGGRRRPARSAPLAFLTGVCLVLLVVVPTTWWSRFTLWIHALGLPAIVVAAQEAAAGLAQKRRHLITLVLFVAAAGLVVWESRTTLDLEWHDGRWSHRGGFDEYLSSPDYVFPGLTETKGVEEVFAARTVARGPWGYNGTLLGGMLAMPLDRREIVALPADPSAEEIDDLRARGIEWIVWDLGGAEEVPATVRAHTVEEHGHPPEPDTEFLFIRLAPLEP